MCSGTGYEAQRDSESGFYYLRARYYHPTIGRFLGQDPVAGSTGNAQSQNRYAYVLNNPVNLIDPVGLSATDGNMGLPAPPAAPDCSGPSSAPPPAGAH